MVHQTSWTRFAIILLTTAFGLTLVAARADAGVTGADACGDASIVPIGVGPAGSPTVTVSSGDLTTATGPDCDFSPDVGVALWWEAFELTECADVTIELCGTTPWNYPTRNYLYTNCPASGTYCGTPIFPTGQSRFNCADNNLWMSFPSLPPGIYYFPILADPNVLANPPGTYQVTMTAQQCAGACCDFTAGTCTDPVLLADCSGQDQIYHAQRDCCDVECITPGETYPAFGVELLSHIPLWEFPGSPSLSNDIWGYASPSGREYALIGLSNSTAVVEVTDPFNPVVIDRISGDSCTWRDIKTFGTYAYIVTDCSGGMDIVDLADVDDGVVRLVQKFTGGGFVHAHNIYLNEDTGFAYWAGSNLGNGGLVAIDLRHPESPTIAGAWPTTYVHDAYVASYTGGPYDGREIAFNFNPGYGFTIVDVTDKEDMYEMSNVTYPTLGTTHQGWLTDDKRYVFFSDESDEASFGLTSTLYVVDVQDLANPELITTFTNGACSIDHNLIIKGGLTYQANYSSGLRIFDTSDVNSIEEVAYFDTYPFGNFVSFVGAWGVYPNLPSGIVLVSDLDGGLFVLNYDCNGNEIDDTIEIANLTSDDCNTNGIPDECEFDCNANDVPDGCDIDPTDPDGNGEVSSDADGNGVPDECEYAMPEPAVGTGEEARTNRYLRFSAPVPTVAGVREEVIRVRCVSLDGFPPPPTDIFYLGPPIAAPEEDTSQPGLTFTAAPLQCDPYAHGWSAEGIISAYGAEIIPGSVYEVQRAGADCADLVTNEACWSVPLSITTAKYGDVWPVWDWENISPQADFNDIAAVVRKFQATPDAPIKAVAQLQPNSVFPDRALDFKDIAADVTAFVGTPTYAESNDGPCACPSTVTCGVTACANDLGCVGFGDGLCVNGFCTDACGRCTP